MTISFVNSAVGGAENVGGATTAASAAFAATTGNTILVFLRTDTSSTVTSVTDTIGNTYTAVPGATGTNNASLRTYLCAASTGTNASNVVTAGNGTTDSIGFWSIHIMQFSGLSATPLDVSDFHGTTGTTMTSNAFTTAQANEVVGFITSNIQGSSPAPKVGGVAATQTTTASGGNTIAAYQIQSATLTSAFATMTSSSSAIAWPFATVSLKDTSGGADPNTLRTLSSPRLV